MVARHRQGLRHQKGEQSETGCGNLNSLWVGSPTTGLLPLPMFPQIRRRRKHPRLI